MWFHIPVKVYAMDKHSRRQVWKKANIGLELKDPEIKGPSLVIKSPGKTVRIDIRSIYGHADPLNLAVHGGSMYRFALLGAYESTENRIMLVRLIEIAKLINKGREFSTPELLACMSADPMVQRFRRAWLQIGKELVIPKGEIYMSRVDLSGQNLKKIPASLGNLLLREVILDNNKLGEKDHFWTWLKGPVCSSIRILSVKNNMLERVPSQIVMCTRLETVCLANNNLKKLPHKLFLDPMSLKKIDVSNNANLIYWPYPVNSIREINIDGCRSLKLGLVQCNHFKMSSPPSLVDNSASVILNHQKLSKSYFGVLPNTLIDKLNWAVFCSKCDRFYTKPVSQERFNCLIRSRVLHSGFPQAPVTALKFDCGCRDP